MWRFERSSTFYIGLLRVKLILVCQDVLKWVWSSTNRNRFFIQTQILPQIMHHKRKEIFEIVWKPPTENQWGPTLEVKSHLKDHYTIEKIVWTIWHVWFAPFEYAVGCKFPCDEFCSFDKTRACIAIQGGKSHKSWLGCEQLTARTSFPANAHRMWNLNCSNNPLL